MSTRDSQIRYGEQLVAAGVATREALAKGLEIQKESGGHLLEILIENHLVEERRALRFMAAKYGARYITSDRLASTTISREALDRIPPRHAERLGVLPLAYHDESHTLTLALTEIDEGLVEQVRLAAGARQVQPVIATRSAIRAGIQRYYHDDIYAFAQVEDTLIGAVVVNDENPPQIQAREPSRDTPAPKGSKGEARALELEAELLRVAGEL
jgi:hypothetical protein